MRIYFSSFPESKVESKIAGFNCRLRLNIKASRICVHVQRVLCVLFKKLICNFFSFMPEWQISHDYNSNADKLQQTSRGPKGRGNGIILSCNMISNVLVEFWLKFLLSEDFQLFHCVNELPEGTSFDILKNLIIHVFLNVLTKLRRKKKRKRWHFTNANRISQPIRLRHLYYYKSRALQRSSWW